MFTATPRLRDQIDLRTALLVAVLALVAFALQLTFLAGTVASPLGDAIVRFEAGPQPEQAGADQAIAAAAAESRPLPRECLVYR